MRQSMQRRSDAHRRLHHALPKPRIAKGRRAKRGRRKEYKDVFLNCGIMTQRESDAVAGLRALRQEPTQQVPLFRPSTSEGLRECAERLTAFVGSAQAVEFWIPQIACILEVDEQTLSFAVNVLVSLKVLCHQKNGSFLWQGREEAWNQEHRPSIQRINEESLNSDDQSHDLSEFCQCILDSLEDSKGPLDMDDLLNEMKQRLKQNATSSIEQELNCTCPVLLGAGIIQEIHHDNKQHYTKPLPASIHNVASKNLQITEQKALRVGVPSSIPVILDDKMAVTRMILDSLVHRADPVDKREAVIPLRDTSSMQAVVVEIAGSKVSQLGVVDVLGHGALKSGNNEHAKHVIALAVPQWMLTNRQSPLPLEQIQANSYKIAGTVQKPFANKQQPMYMSCVPVPPGSLSELLRNAANRQRSACGEPQSLDPASYTKLKQF